MISDRYLTIAMALLAMLLASPVFGETREEKRVQQATEVLDQFLRIPEQSVPPTLLSRAYGVAVIPGVIKAGLTVGARHGKGILVVRRDDGSWSNPSFVALTGGSVGFQIGVQSSDIILVFKTRRSVDGIANGTLTLGGDASIAAGPVGRQAGAATDLAFKAEVVSYSRSRGLFAGVALQGAGVTMDRKANAAFYGSAGMTPEKIFASARASAPQAALSFVDLLTTQTSRLPAQASAPATAAPRQPVETESSVRTFAVPDPDADTQTDNGEYDASY